ncbi:unnamed protein product [Clavelina lepadiformis]
MASSKNNLTSLNTHFTAMNSGLCHILSFGGSTLKGTLDECGNRLRRCVDSKNRLECANVKHGIHLKSIACKNTFRAAQMPGSLGLCVSVHTSCFLVHQHFASAHPRYRQNLPYSRCHIMDDANLVHISR